VRARIGKKGIFMPAKMLWKELWFPALRSTLWNLGPAVSFLRGETPLEPVKESFQELLNNRPYILDFADVKGQESVKRTESPLPEPIPSYVGLREPVNQCWPQTPLHLASMTWRSSGVTQITALRLLKPGQIFNRASFRAPHQRQQCRPLGGAATTPGEITLAHHGVLFWMSCLNSTNRPGNLAPPWRMVS
jgi:magnesium chelatase family protein